MTRGVWFWHFLYSLVNISIRGFALAARFALTVYIAKFFDIETLGAFGLLSGAIQIAPAVLGLGLNYWLNREVVNLPAAIAINRIRDRLLVTIAMLFLAGFALFLLSLFGMAPSLPHAGLLFAIGFLEIIAYDLHMNLISLRMPTFANMLLFVRSASWIYVYIAFSSAFPSYRDFGTLLFFWLGGLLLNYIILAARLPYTVLRQIAATPIDGAWIRDNIKRATFPYLTHLGFVGTTFIDRFIIFYKLSLTETGIFTFYWALANAVQLLVEVGVVQIALPKIIDAGRSEHPAEFLHILVNEFWKALGLGLAVALVVYCVTTLAIPFLDRPQLQSYAWLFPALLVGSLLKSFSDIAGYGLYAKESDRAFALTSLAGVPLSAILNYVGVSVFGLNGIAVATIATTFLLLAIRLGALYPHFAR